MSNVRAKATFSALAIKICRDYMWAAAAFLTHSTT